MDSVPPRPRRARAKLTEGPVGPTLVRLAFPMFIGILAIMLFNVVDTYFVGRLGARPLAAMGYTFPVVFLVTGAAMGMGIGVSSVVSRAIGRDDEETARRLTTLGLILALGLVAVIVLVGVTNLDRLFGLMGAEPDLLPLIRSYMIPWYMGVGLFVIPLVGNSAVRATGDTTTPSLIMILAGLVNVGLDPLLIFGPGPFPALGLQGAALATVASYACAFAAAFWVLRVREDLLTFSFPGWQAVLAGWGRILHVALPAVCTNLMAPLATGILTRLVSGYGPDAVAAFGVGTRLESLCMSAMFALSTAIAPFAGQNFGANRCDRVRTGIRFAFMYNLAVSLTIWVLISSFAGSIAALFNDTPAIVDIVRRFIWIVPISYGFFGLQLQIAATFNAKSRPEFSVAIFLSRFFVFIVPLAWAGSIAAGIPGIFVGIAAGNVLGGLGAYALFAWHIRQPDAEPGPAETAPAS